MKRIVAFADGTFGIRYGLFFHTYQDFVSQPFRWFGFSKNMIDCKTDYDTAYNFFIKDKIMKVSNSKGIFK